MSHCCSSRLAIIRSLVSSLPSLDLDLAYELNLTCDLDSDLANDQSYDLSLTYDSDLAYDLDP